MLGTHLILLACLDFRVLATAPSGSVAMVARARLQYELRGGDESVDEILYVGE